MKIVILALVMITFFTIGISFAQTTVTPGNGTLQEAIIAAQPGDVLQLIGGAEYSDDSSSIALLDKPITIQVEHGATQKAIVRLGDSVPSGSYYFFMIMNGASLTLKGIEFSGLVGGTPIAKCLIKFDGNPDPANAKVGSIKIDNCVAHDFTDNLIHGFSKSSMKGMIQDSLFINNSVIYNAKTFLRYKYVSLRYMSIKNSTFYKASSYGIFFGNESDRGTEITPTAFIDHCTYNDMAPFIEVDEMSIPWTVTNCIFSNISVPSKTGLYWSNPKIDPVVTIKNTCIWNYGGSPSSTEPLWPGYVFEDTVSVDPQYQDAANGDFTLPVGSPLLTFGTDGAAIGDPRWATNAPSGVRQAQGIIPVDFILSQNYPNPFNPVTTIDFSVVKTADVKLHIYDISGALVETVVSGELNAGMYSVEWDASSVSSGIYFYRLIADGKSKIRKMTLLK
ncbi:MAG: DUF5123 domain-containing protein [bacterium]|nr:MAG: DUF5123 domain-containing protein [bacterium]